MHRPLYAVVVVALAVPMMIWISRVQSNRKSSSGEVRWFVLLVRSVMSGCTRTVWLTLLPLLVVAIRVRTACSLMRYMLIRACMLGMAPSLQT